MNNKNKGLIWYLVIAFAITWGSVLGIYLLGGAPTSIANVPSAGPLVGLLMMLATFGPAFAAFVTLKWITREGFKDAGLRFNFRTGWAYYLWAVLAPIAACVMAIALAGALGMEVSLGALSLENIIAWIVGTLIWTPILFGEEFGWRGYLQPRLAPGRPLLAALLIGLIWGIWHYAQVLAGIVLSANLLALLIYPLSCIVGSIFLGWFSNSQYEIGLSVGDHIEGQTFS